TCRLLAFRPRDQQQGVAGGGADGGVVILESGAQVVDGRRRHGAHAAQGGGGGLADAGVFAAQGFAQGRHGLGKILGGRDLLNRFDQGIALLQLPKFDGRDQGGQGR